MEADKVGYRAIVEKVVSKGPHGPYAVTRSQELGSVTVSLDSGVWQEEDWPEPGMFVILSKIRKKRAGWCAKYGRFLGPSDDKQTAKERSKEQ